MNEKQKAIDLLSQIVDDVDLELLDEVIAEEATSTAEEFAEAYLSIVDMRDYSEENVEALKRRDFNALERSAS